MVICINKVFFKGKSLVKYKFMVQGQEEKQYRVGLREKKRKEKIMFFIVLSDKELVGI